MSKEAQAKYRKENRARYSKVQRGYERRLRYSYRLLKEIFPRAFRFGEGEVLWLRLSAKQADEVRMVLASAKLPARQSNTAPD